MLGRLFTLLALLCLAWLRCAPLGFSWAWLRWAVLSFACFAVLCYTMLYCAALGLLNLSNLSADIRSVNRD
jgi:hypothetical protein